MTGLFDDDIADDGYDAFEDAARKADAAAEDGKPVMSECSPRLNADLVGHAAAEKSFLDDYNAGRLPHAIVLSGPDGIGKATLAYRLARFLLAQPPDDAGGGFFGEVPPKPDSLCIAPDHPVFRRVASGGHADLLVVERELDEKKGRLKTEISVESVRRIHPFLRKTAAEGGWRAVIVDGAEYLNANSQNALLKILEEPPAKTLLVLTTSQPGLFLPTIRSRCRMVDMAPLPEAEISRLLDRMVSGLSAEEKTVLSRIADGSIGRALRFFSEDGVALYREMLTLTAALPAMDAVRMHEISEKYGKAGGEAAFDTAREILTDWCARIVRAQARGQPVPDTLPGDGKIFAGWMMTYPAAHFLDAWEKISRLFVQAENCNLDRKQILMMAFLMLQKPGHPELSLQ